MSRSPTATLRLLPIWNARSQTVAGSSKAISSASGQTSMGGPSQPPRANQPEIVSISSGVVRITGIVLGWIGATTPFASQVRKLNRRCSISPSAFLRVPVQGRQMPANTNNGRLSSRANHTGVFFGLVSAYSENEVAGTTPRHSGLSQPRQYGLLTLRTLVTGWVPRFGGGGKPQRMRVS